MSARSRPARAAVVDASVAVKWVLPEDHAKEADALLSGAWALHAPSHWLAEAATSVWARTAVHKVQTDDVCRERTAFFLTVAVRETPLRDLLEDAVDLALRLHMTCYDSAYLALGLRLAAPVVTADRKLFAKASAGGLGASVVWLPDLPAATAGAPAP